MARMAWEGRGSQAMNAARLVLLLVAVAAGRVGGDDASMLHPLRPHDVMEMNLTKVRVGGVDYSVPAHLLYTPFRDVVQVIEDKHDAVEHKWQGQAPLLSDG
ncbi:hypothetical protein T484DRAFT_1896728, partial [Baffinella frigidus]